MTVAQLQALLSDFDPEAEVHFGYPAIDNYGSVYRERSVNIIIDELNVNNTGCFAPIIFINGAAELED